MSSAGLRLGLFLALAMTWTLFLGGGLTKHTFAVFSDAGTGSQPITAGQWILTLEANQDSWVDSTAVNDNHGSESSMWVNEVLILLQHESFVQFDLSGLPAGTTINDADLQLCVTSILSASLDHDVEVVLGPWDESTLTWDNKPGVAGAGGLFLLLTIGPSCFSVDVRSHVQDWADGTTANNGWRLSTNLLGLLVEYATSEHPTAALRPQLTIDFTPP